MGLEVRAFFVLSLISLQFWALNAQLSPFFYLTTCPEVEAIVQESMAQAIDNDPRMGASILRMFFHDCFVNGCDGSVLLDDTATLTGEKNAFPNKNSLRGFEIIDGIKSNLEAACSGIVSCADILALAARDSVYLLGGPTWSVPLGRRDATTASQSAANSNLPPPTANLSNLISMFSRKGLNARDMTALSGGHTIGQARCSSFRQHIYNDTDIDTAFAATRKATCPASSSGSGGNNLAPLDVASPNLFDNGYFQDLVAKQGLLHSDQELFNGGSQDALVMLYSRDANAFAIDFANAMIKMGNISPLTGSSGQIRLNCRVVN